MSGNKREAAGIGGKMTIWIYRFEDGTKLELLNTGLSTAELLELWKLHGTITVDFREVAEMEGWRWMRWVER